MNLPQVGNLAVRSYPNSTKRWMIVIITGAGENVLTSRDYQLHQSNNPGQYPAIKSVERATELMNDWHRALQAQPKTKSKGQRHQPSS